MDPNGTENKNVLARSIKNVPDPPIILCRASCSFLIIIPPVIRTFICSPGLVQEARWSCLLQNSVWPYPNNNNNNNTYEKLWRYNL
jgi:hypothetical protein